jgi:predicted membrane protein
MTTPRLISLALAALVGLVILLHPEWLAEGAGWMERTGLTLALIGFVGAAAYGFGHLPERRVLQIVQSPKVAWPAMLLGLIVINVNRVIWG